MGNWTMILTAGGNRGKSGIYQKYYDLPVVIVTPRAEILLPPATFKMLGEPRAVHLYTDPRDMKFAIEACSTDEKNVYLVQLRHGGKTNTGANAKKSPMNRISASSFVKSSGLIVEDHVVILRGDLDQDGKFVVDMKQRREIETYRHRVSIKR